MKVQVDVINKTAHYTISVSVEDWDTCKTTSDVYRAAMQEYGRCSSKMFIDRHNGAKHIGWVFVKRAEYGDCKETFLQETWICPLLKHEVKTVIEYALER